MMCHCTNMHYLTENATHSHLLFEIKNCMKKHCLLVQTCEVLFLLCVKESGIDPWMVVPHGSYLLNCGSSDDEVLRKTRETLVDELKRCEKLGLPIYNFHPGLLIFV